MPIKSDKNITVVYGPTACGKTAYAIELAKQQNAIVINADAMQCYAGLPILTAQPDMVERQGIQHELFSFLTQEETLTAAKWVKHVEKIITETDEKKPIILVGGTGFYLNALIKGLSPIPNVAPAYIKELNDLETAELFATLQKIDPVLANKIKPNDRQRIIRGVSVYKSSGKPLSYWQSLPPAPPKFDCTVHILVPKSRETLSKRIELRLNKMLQQDVLNEVHEVYKNYQLQPLTGLKAHGYKHFCQYNLGQISLEKALDATALETRQYAKRQMTWSRTQLKPDVLIDIP